MLLCTVLFFMAVPPFASCAILDTRLSYLKSVSVASSVKWGKKVPTSKSECGN